MLGVQIIYILLFSTIQFGTGGYFIALRKRKRLNVYSRDVAILTGLFLCYNLLVLLGSWAVFDLVEVALLLLPTVLFWYFTRNFDGNKEIGVSKIRTFILLLSSLGLTLLVWYLLKHYTGLGIVTIAPVLIILYSLTGVLMSVQMKVGSKERVPQMIVVLIVTGFVVLLLTSVLFIVEGDLGSHLTINFLYIFILLEYIVRNSFDLLKFSVIPFTDEYDQTDQKESVKYPSLNGYGLTKTEISVAEYLLDGLSFQEISNQTGQSKNVLYQHAHKIYRKTGTFQQTFLLQFVKADTHSNNTDGFKTDSPE